MGRSQAYDAALDVSEDVSLEAYLAGRRPLPHLFDLVPQQALGPDCADVDVTLLATTVRQQGEPQTDVRFLIGYTESHFAVASELANMLRCDVYLPPPNAHVRYVRESSSVTGESWDAVAMHPENGEPTPWLLVRPDERTDVVPTWFVNTRGRLRQNNGLITVPLPPGLAFATTSTFPDTAALARHITTGPRSVTTLAVTADIGRFEISRFNESSALLGGVEFATLVAASLDEIQPDVQIALTWPAEVAARATLDVELMRLADALDRTVWVPRPAGTAEVPHDRGEFAAVDERGRPSTWHAYASRLATHWEPSLGTDADGCLVPIEHPSVRSPGTPCHPPPAPSSHPPATTPSGPPTRALSPTSASTTASTTAATTAVASSDPIAETVRLAERAANRPVFMPASPTVLLATVGRDATPTPRLVEHCVSWLSPSVVVNQDPIELYVWLPPASAHTGDWVVSAPDVFLLADADPARLADRGRTGQLLRLTAPAQTAVDLSEHADHAPERVRRRVPEHGGTYVLPLTWIARYQVTGRFDVDSSGRLTARPDAAASHIAHPQAGCAEAGRAEVGWAEVGWAEVGWAEVGRAEVGANVLDVWFDGADHGVSGLPNEVVTWPGEDLRADTPSYLVLPEGVPFDHSGFVPLSRQRPELAQGSRILEIKVRRRRAIDVPATLDLLARLPMIGRLQEFADFDLLLSEQDFPRAVVSKVWRHGPDGEPILDKLGGDTLSDVLAAST